MTVTYFTTLSSVTTWADAKARCRVIWNQCRHFISFSNIITICSTLPIYAYPQVIPQCSKPRPVLALHHVHNREASLTQILCRERQECFSRLLRDDGVLLSEEKNEAIPVDKCFSFTLLLFLISIRSSSSATVISADSNALDTNGSLVERRYVKWREILFNMFTQQWQTL
jgi:hypothetical protein